MAIEIKNVYLKLKQIKDNLGKLSYARRTKSVLNQKLAETLELRNKFEEYLPIILDQIENKQIQGQVLEEVQTYCDLIKDLYIQIEEFCSKDYSSYQNSAQGVERVTTSMANFDFKTAVSLLPVMPSSSDEGTTLNLIDAIDLYSASLSKEGRDMLIKFVLKTRLNQSAKLRLLDSYTSCEALINDMRLHLVTKKSSTSLHSELVQIRQNGMSLDQYGSKIEQLFVDLTISQANGDSSAYGVLKTVNEKIAIKSFTDGLKNRQLSLILSARNYTTLKDSIRAAKDEEISCRQNTEPTMYFNQRGRPNGNRGWRGNYSGIGNRSHHPNAPNGRGRTFFNSQLPNRAQNQPNQSQRSRGFGNRPFRSFRGRHNGNYRNNNNINYMENNDIGVPNETQQNPGEESLLFFR